MVKVHFFLSQCVLVDICLHILKKMIMLLLLKLEVRFFFFLNLLESSEDSIIERTITALVSFTDDNTSDDDVVW